jgi:hypothetical protein
MNLEWNAVLNSTVTFIILLILKTLLDLKIAQFFVKNFSWIPVRNIFRTKPATISGQWEQIWDSAGSASFKDETDRHSHPTINQLGSYCYAEFISKGVTYVVFGKIINEYFVGDWYDLKDPHGYFGAFQLQIIDSNTMKGQWIGHSKKVHQVKGDEWNWRKLNKG